MSGGSDPASKPPFHPFRSEQARRAFETLYAERARAWPLPVETLRIETASGSTFVRCGGRASDPPLVLLAGARGTSLMWAPNVAALSERHRTYALDTITDIGLSVPRRERFGADELVAWLHEVVGVLAPERPVDVVGMSYGGWLAALYASRHPERVRRLVLMAPGGVVRRLSLAFFVRVMLVLTLRRPGANESALLRTLRWLFTDAVKSSEDMRRFVEHDVLNLLQAGRCFALPRPIWPTVFDRATWRSWSVPGLLLVGENEKIYPARAVVKRLHRVAPLFRSQVIPGAGHDLTFVQPDLVNRAVLDFLDEPSAVAA